MDTNKLINKAMEARLNSYSPYSNFQVGAALLTSDSRIYTGCNIESASFSPTNCAERTAVFKAVSEGVRDFSAIAVTGGPRGQFLEYCFPCGVCLQVLSEFTEPDIFLVITAKSPDDFQTFSLSRLLPYGFRLPGRRV